MKDSNSQTLLLVRKTLKTEIKSFVLLFYVGVVVLVTHKEFYRKRRSVTESRHTVIHWAYLQDERRAVKYCCANLSM